MKLEELRKWTLEERFYRKYAHSRQDPQKFKTFLASLDVSKLIEQGLVVPEFPETLPNYFMDDYTQSCAEGGLIPEKRLRCKPPFLHQHAFFEIIYVLEGKCLHYSKAAERSLVPGDICVIPPGVEHEISIGEDCLAMAFRCSAAAIRQIFTRPCFGESNAVTTFFTANSISGYRGSCLFLHTGDNGELKQLALDIYEESRNKYSQYVPTLYALFELFWARIMRFYLFTCEISNELPADMLIVQTIYNYIQDSPEHANLADLARTLHYTPEYASKVIREQTGFTFTTLVTQAKISKSAQLLKNTNYAVGRISELVGYQNAESFIRAFKKEFHMTPAEYRNSAQA